MSASVYGRLPSIPEYYKDSIDGSFGPNTEKAVKEFQAKVVKLKKPDGVITAGNNTWKKLLQG